LVISDELTPLGTAGTIKNAEELIHSEPFLVMNGDSFCSVDLAQFYEFHSLKEAFTSIVVVKSEDPADYGSVLLDQSQRIIGFEEKGRAGEGGHVNAGIYFFRQEILSLIPANTEYSLEYELFPRLVERDSYAFVSHEQLIDIGTPQRYERASLYFSDHPAPANLR
jgi:NDP-sugar pyrophosphorylase family protein